MSIDVSYLAKLQDYYARHNVIPSYATLGKLWGISAKSWVANYVNRFKEEGYLKLAPDRRLGPGPRFFERRSPLSLPLKILRLAMSSCPIRAMSDGSMSSFRSFGRLMLAVRCMVLRN